MRFLSLLLIALISMLRAEPVASSSQGYHLYPRDVIKVEVHGEADLTVERRIDGDGRVSLPLIGSLLVRGLTCAQAETLIADTYKQQEILIRPNISVTVADYSPKEISVLGQVKNPGKITLPIETEKMSLVEAISRAGGFTRIAKTSAVRVTRHNADGTDETFTYNADALLAGGSKTASVEVQAADVLFVPESVF